MRVSVLAASPNPSCTFPDLPSAGIVETDGELNAICGCWEALLDAMRGCEPAGVLVGDAADAYTKATSNGAMGKLKPIVLRDEATGAEQVVSEVHLYGDVVLRFVSGSFQVSIAFHHLWLARFHPWPEDDTA